MQDGVYRTRDNKILALQTSSKVLGYDSTGINTESLEEAVFDIKDPWYISSRLLRILPKKLSDIKIDLSFDGISRNYSYLSGSVGLSTNFFTKSEDDTKQDGFITPVIFDEDTDDVTKARALGAPFIPADKKDTLSDITNIAIGTQSFDTENKQPVWWDGEKWSNIAADSSKPYIELEAFDGNTPNSKIIALNPTTQQPAIYNEKDKKWYDIVVNSNSDNVPDFYTKILRARMAFIDTLVLARGTSYIRFPINRGNSQPDVNLDFQFKPETATFLISDNYDYKKYFGKAVKYKIDGSLQSNTLILQDKSTITDTSNLTVGEQAYDLTSKKAVWWNGQGWDKVVLDNQLTDNLVATKLQTYTVQFIDSSNTQVNFPNMWGALYGERTRNNGITLKYFEKSRTADERKAIETEIANEITDATKKAQKLEEIANKTYTDSKSVGLFPNYNVYQTYNRNLGVNLNNYYYDGPIITKGSLNPGKVSDLTSDCILQDGAIALDDNNKPVVYNQSTKTWNNLIVDKVTNCITTSAAVSDISYTNILVMRDNNALIRFPIYRKKGEPDVNLDIKYEETTYTLNFTEHLESVKTITYNFDGILQSTVVQTNYIENFTDTSDFRLGVQSYSKVAKKPVWWNGTNWTDAMGNIIDSST